MGTEPINLLAEIVINSANDVLSGCHTFQDHLVYLQEEKNRYEREGTKLPLDLSEPIEKEPEHEQQQHCNDKHVPRRRNSSSKGNKKTIKRLHDNPEGLLSWSD